MTACFFSRSMRKKGRGADLPRTTVTRCSSSVTTEMQCDLFSHGCSLLNASLFLSNQCVGLLVFAPFFCDCPGASKRAGSGRAGEARSRGEGRGEDGEEAVEGRGTKRQTPPAPRAAWHAQRRPGRLPAPVRRRAPRPRAAGPPCATSRGDHTCIQRQVSPGITQHRKAPHRSREEGLWTPRSGTVKSASQRNFSAVRPPGRAGKGVGEVRSGPLGELGAEVGHFGILC